MKSCCICGTFACICLLRVERQVFYNVQYTGQRFVQNGNINRGKGWNHMTAVIDVGGGLRGIYAAGVLDWCLEQGIHFDVGIGVSAGAANIASFLGGQKGRNVHFYTEYALRKEYMSVGNLLRKKSYIDMDYVYGTLSNAGGENPLDYAAIAADPAQFIIVATNARTGAPRYFTKEDLHADQYDVIKASCSIPVVCPPYVVDGTPYYDGALSDPIPVEQAFALGCDQIVLILTRPKDFYRTPRKDKIMAALIRHKYPKAAEAFRQRAELYNRKLDQAKDYEAQGKLLIVAPDDTCGMDTLTRDTDAMRRFYQKGLHDAPAIRSFLGGI